MGTERYPRIDEFDRMKVHIDSGNRSRRIDNEAHKSSGKRNGAENTMLANDASEPTTVMVGYVATKLAEYGVAGLQRFGRSRAIWLQHDERQDDRRSRAMR